MRELFAILGSLVRPLFGGIFQVFVGGLGIGTAIAGWAQLALAFYLANGHTSAGIIGTTVFGIGLLIVQAAAALMSFSVPNGNGYSPKNKQESTAGMFIGAAVWSAIIAVVLTYLVSWVLGIFITITGTLALAAVTTIVAVIQSAVIVGRLVALTNKPV